MKPARRIEISYKTIVFTVAFILSLVLLWNIRDILLLFFICLVFMEVLNPTINSLEKIKIPRTIAIVLIYAIVIVVFSFALAGIIPVLVNQTSGLLKTLPETLQNVRVMGISALDFSSQFRILETIPADIARTVMSFFSNLFSGFLILVITFYLLLERRRLDHYSSLIFKDRGQKAVTEIFQELEVRLASWVNGQLILMASIGFLSYAGYVLLGLDYALPLALIAGLLEIVPTVGPFLTTVLAGLIGLSISGWTAALTVIWGIVIQQLENNFIVPKVMNATVGLHPIITILVITIGAKFAGVGGALLAVPVYITLETVFRVLIKYKK